MGFGLELNLEKTRIVYCKDDDCKGNHEYTSFDFLGYTFRPRHAKNKYGKFFTNFLPAMGEKEKKSIRRVVLGWKLQFKTDKDLWDIANMFNKQIQGWINYYTHFYKSEIYGVLRYINRRLVYWVRRKYKNRKSRQRAEYWLGEIAMRVKNVQTLENRPNGYRSCADQAVTPEIRLPFRTRETTYVPDYLSGNNNELLSYEKGVGATRVTYGPGYGRLSQKFSLEPEASVTSGMKIASSNIGKSYFQSDPLGSPLFASNQQGEVLRYAQRSTWGDLNPPMQGDLNTSGIEDSLLFTNYSYDPVIDKYFAKARFYDAGQGRMCARDPVKRGLNPYPYCKNNPVNYVDPTGEVVNVLAGAGLGLVTGGAFGFIESAVTQISNREDFDPREALGAGLALSLAANFGAGAAGSALEQWIGSGEADFGESMKDGLINAISGAIYGKNPIKSAVSAFGRGAGAGAATAALNNLANAWDPRKRSGKRNAGTPGRLSNGRGVSPYTKRRDPRTCGAPGAFSSQLGYDTPYGYQYKTTGTNQTKQDGFSLGGFMKDVLIGAAMGGLSGLAFYGADKKISALRNSIRSKGGSAIEELTIASRNTSRGKPNAINHFDVDLNTRQNNLLRQLPSYDSSIIVKKSGVNLNDLFALTAKTGNEFAMFTRGSQRMIVRGGPNNVNINGLRAQELASA